MKNCEGVAMKNILKITLIIAVLLLSIGFVSANENITDVISLDNESVLSDIAYDKVVDHRDESETYNQIYTPFEVEEGETFVKNIGLTHIEVKNTEDERSYHEITYTYKNGQKVIADEWSCPLYLGGTNVNRGGEIVCHVLLHGNEIVKEKQPIYKTVKVNKKVVSKYKNVKVASYIKSDSWCNKYVVKDLKHRIKIYDYECCPSWVSNIVKKVNKYHYTYKIQILKKYPNKKYPTNGGFIKGGYKIKIILYKKKPVYKTVKVNKKELTGYKVLNVLHMY